MKEKRREEGADQVMKESERKKGGKVNLETKKEGKVDLEMMVEEVDLEMMRK